MNYLIVNTSEQTGGAAIASNRLMKALNKNGIKAKMLVAHKQTDDPNVIEVGGAMQKKIIFLWERLKLFVHYGFRREGLFDIDSGDYGLDITKTREYQEADVIHLNWINQGFVSLRTIQKILLSGKPLVWTMHDIWPATAICHVAQTCGRYRNGECSHCPLLKSQSANDYANKIWKRKRKVYQQGKITFIGPSLWITNEAKQSPLLNGQTIVNIPNTIDTLHYRRLYDNENFLSRKQELKRNIGCPEDFQVILFVSQRTSQLRKGIQYLIEALELMKQKDPHFVQSHCVAILGGNSEEMAYKMPVPAIPLGYVNNDDPKIIYIYNAADVFVTPSLDDNLPNTLMEAMACGLPCVGFNIGGIPEMIDHRKNGYVAKAKDTDDLTKGIEYVLNHPDYLSLSDNALSKIDHSYSEQSVVKRYIKVCDHLARSMS